MSEQATLRRLRGTNSKLMKGNLALLMSIRETDCDIEAEWRELQQCCGLLEERGLAVPSSCLALMGAATNDETESITQHDDAKDPAADEAKEDAQHVTTTRDRKEPSARPISSVLSVRSVLNAESSDDGEEEEGSDNTGESSASDHGSADEP